jgi:hypothetical protein
MSTARKVTITKTKADTCDMILPLATKMRADVQELTKKKQDGVLNKTQLILINRLLQTVKELLSGEPSHPFLDLLDEDAIPQNADALLVVGQHMAALEAFREKYRDIDKYDFTSSWRLKN